MLTFTFDEFLAAGGMQSKERAAAERAITEERKFWLPILEAHLATLSEQDDVLTCVQLEAEINRLRRALHLPSKPSPQAVERRRQQTRERVRRYRQRQRAAE